MRKRFHWYKKSYSHSVAERIFTMTLSIFLVLSANLVSHTFDIPNLALKIIEAAVLTLLTAVILFRAESISREVESGKRTLVSDNAQRHLLIVKRFSVFSVIPLFITVFSHKENMELFGILFSVVLIILFKTYLDLVVAFDDAGYLSGFDNIRITHLSETLKVEEREHMTIGAVVTFELFTDGKYRGYDKFTGDEYAYLSGLMEKKKIPKRSTAR